MSSYNIKTLIFFFSSCYHLTKVRTHSDLCVELTVNFKICEELPALQTLKSITTGQDIFEKVHQMMEYLGFDLAKLTNTITSGA